MVFLSSGKRCQDAQWRNVGPMLTSIAAPGVEKHQLSRKTSSTGRPGLAPAQPTSLTIAASFPHRQAMQHLVNPAEVEFSAIRAQGPGGQNVNKVSSAIHLRFPIAASSLPEAYKERLLALRDSRISKDGVLVLKAQQSRSQEQNKEEALRRLQEIIDSVTFLPAVRRATKPTRSSQRRRLDSKSTHSVLKQSRGKVTD